MAKSADDQWRLNDLLSAVDIGVWYSSVPFDTLYWDGKVREHLGIRPGSPATFEGFYGALHPEDREATRVAIANSVATRTALDCEYRTVSPEGRIRRIHSIGRFFPNAKNETVRFDGLTVDVTSAKEMEEELVRSRLAVALSQRSHVEETERQFRDLVDSIPQLAWMADEKGTIFWYNRRWYEFTGTTPEDMETRGWQSVHDPAELPRVLETWQSCVAAGVGFELVFPLRGADGEYRQFLTRAVPFAGSRGHVVRWFGTNTDITKQRRAEEALRLSRERLQAALEASATGTFLWDIRTGEIDWDESLDLLFGIADRQKVRDLRGLLSVVHPEDRARVISASNNSSRKGADFELEFRVVWPDLSIHWVRARGKTLLDSDGAARRMTGACTDITGRKEAEELLAERARLSSLGAAIGAALTEDAPLRKTLRKCTEAIVHHLDGAFARIWSLSDNGKFLELEASAGLYTHIDGAHARVPVGMYKIGQIAAERLPHLTNDVLHDHRIGDPEWAKREGMTAFAGYPLIVDDRLVGVIALFARKPLREATLTALAYIAANIALGIERKHNDAARIAGEARKTAILETALDCFVTIDASGKILEFNAAAEQTFGYKRADVIGGPMAVLMMPAEYREKHATGMARYLREGTTNILGKRLELRGMRSDGSDFPVEVSVSRIPGDGPILFTATLRDITDRQKAQKDLQEAKIAAEDANRAKSDFLATMSHELRTPLNAIIGYGEMLQEEAEELGVMTLVPDLKKIHGAGKHLLALINDILDLSKIEAGKMELFLETFSVSDMVDDAANFVSSLVQQNNNKLEVRLGPNLGEMRADLIKVRQSLFNLLANAAKFTSNGTVLVEANVDSEDPGQLVFCVQDSGIGLSEDQIARLFQAFQQSDRNVSRKYGGTGLGLALTQRFCRLMGGDVTVTSKLGQGARFSIRLPRTVATVVQTGPVQIPGAMAEGSAVAGEESRRIVLIIDDDPDACSLIDRVVTKEGFHGVIAHNGEDGLRMARELKPVLITLDVMMPRMDGWTVLTALKKAPDLQHIPVIMLTMTDDRNLGYTLGASDYLTKPVERERLATVLRRYGCATPPCSALIVDDDEDNRRVLKLMLKHEGWIVSEATDGKHGLEQVARHNPSLILLDLMMPVMDGFEFLLEFRRDPERRNTPVLVLTSKDLTEEDRSRLSGQVERVLTKTRYTKDDLLRELKQAIQNCRI